MCLIVDANQAHAVFSKPSSELAAPIWEWLTERGGIVVYGGQLAAELAKLGATQRLLAELRRAGKAHLEAEAEIRATEERLLAAGGLKSDDCHVIALAFVSGARVLVTEDQALMTDFGNPALLAPKGRIYRRPEHRHLLGHRRGCRGAPSRRSGRRTRRQVRK